MIELLHETGYMPEFIAAVVVTVIGAAGLAVGLWFKLIGD